MNVTATSCGLFAAAADVTATRVAYVPAARGWPKGSYMETWTVSVVGATDPLSVAVSQSGPPSGKLRARPLRVPPSPFTTLTVSAGGAGLAAGRREGQARRR